MNPVHNRYKTCPNCGCKMHYAPALGRLKCAYCDGEAIAGNHLAELAKLEHFIVPHRIESGQAINVLAKALSADTAYPDDALANVQVMRTHIVLLPCYRYRYFSKTSNRVITKTYYSGRIAGLDYERAQWLVAKSTPYIQPFSHDFITGDILSYDSPYDAKRYFFARPLNHRQQHHDIQHIDYVHVAVARVSFLYGGVGRVFWCTCYREDKQFSPPDPYQKGAFFRPRLGWLTPALVVVGQIIGGWLFFRHSLPSWSLLSLAATGLGICGVPVRRYLFNRISAKRRQQFYQAFIDGEKTDGIKRFKYWLCDLLVMPGISAFMLGVTYLVERFWIL